MRDLYPVEELNLTAGGTDQLLLLNGGFYMKSHSFTDANDRGHVKGGGVSCITSVWHIVRESTLRKLVPIFNEADNNLLVIRKEMQAFFVIVGFRSLVPLWGYTAGNAT